MAAGAHLPVPVLPPLPDRSSSCATMVMNAPGVSLRFVLGLRAGLRGGETAPPAPARPLGSGHLAACAFRAFHCASVSPVWGRGIGELAARACRGVRTCAVARGRFFNTTTPGTPTVAWPTWAVASSCDAVGCWATAELYVLRDNNTTMI